MMRFIVCLLLAVTFGCGEKRNTVAINAAPKPWVTFTHPSRNFSILVPELPEARAHQNGAETRTVFSTTYGDSATIVMAELPNQDVIDLTDMARHLEMLKELLRSNHPTSKILSERTFALQGKYPAIDAVMEVSVPQVGLAKQRMRMVVLPKITIMIQAIGLPAEVDTADITKCLDSLKIRG